jgi:hypothetical protein
MVLMLGIVALFLADWYWRHISESYEAAKVHPGQLVLSAVGIALLLAMGWLGGINDPIKVDRRVSPSGHIYVGTQQIHIGKTYARKAVTVFFRGDFLHIEIEPGRSINVPRISKKQPARFEARSDEELDGVPWQVHTTISTTPWTLNSGNSRVRPTGDLLSRPAVPLAAALRGHRWGRHGDPLVPPAGRTSRSSSRRSVRSGRERRGP